MKDDSKVVAIMIRVSFCLLSVCANLFCINNFQHAAMLAKLDGMENCPRSFWLIKFDMVWNFFRTLVLLRSFFVLLLSWKEYSNTSGGGGGGGGWWLWLQWSSLSARHSRFFLNENDCKHSFRFCGKILPSNKVSGKIMEAIAKSDHLRTLTSLKCLLLNLS